MSSLTLGLHFSSLWLYGHVKEPKTSTVTMAMNKLKAMLTQHATNRLPTLHCSSHCLVDSILSCNHGVFIPLLAIVTSQNCYLAFPLSQWGKVWDLYNDWSEIKQKLALKFMVFVPCLKWKWLWLFFLAYSIPIKDGCQPYMEKLKLQKYSTVYNHGQSPNAFI